VCKECANRNICLHQKNLNTNFPNEANSAKKTENICEVRAVRVKSILAFERVTYVLTTTKILPGIMGKVSIKFLVLLSKRAFRITPKMTNLLFQKEGHT